MSHTMRILEPKGYEPSFHKKALSRPEDGFFSRSNSESKGYDEMLMQENDNDYEEYNTREVLEEALFRNMPEVVPCVIPNHQQENCIAKLQEIEKDLEKFSEDFGSQLHNLRMSMRESFSSTPDSRTSNGSFLEISTLKDKDKDIKLGAGAQLHIWLKLLRKLSNVRFRCHKLRVLSPPPLHCDGSLSSSSHPSKIQENGELDVTRSSQSSTNDHVYKGSN